MARPNPSAHMPSGSCYNSAPNRALRKPKLIGATVMKRSSCRCLFGGIVNYWRLLALFALVSIPVSTAQAGDATPAQSGPTVPQASGMPQEEITLLEPGRSIDRELAGAQTDTFRIALARDQHASVTVEQLGVDVVVQVSDSTGQLLAEFDSESRKEGTEVADLVAESAAEFRLNIKARYPRVAAGRYELRTSEIRAANEN